MRWLLILSTGLFAILAHPAVADPAPRTPEEMRRFLDQLGSEEAPLRDAAEAAILGGWNAWDEEAVKALREAPRRPDLEIATRAANVLRRVELRRDVGRRWGKLLEGLPAVIDGGDPEKRQSWCRAAIATWSQGRASDDDLSRLCQLVMEEGWEVYVPSVSEEILRRKATPFAPLVLLNAESGERYSREDALHSLAVLRPTALLEQVALLLRDRDVSREAGMALAAMRLQDHPEVMEKLLAMEDPALTRPLLEFADVCGAEVPAARLEAALAGKDVEVRVMALRVMRRTEPARFLERIRAALADAELCAGAGGVLRGRVTPGLLEMIRPMLSDPTVEKRYAAAFALSRGGADATCLPGLEKAVSEGEIFAVLAIANSRAPERIGALRRSLVSNEQVLKGYAMQSLGLLRSREDVETLKALLKDTNVSIRANAANALGALGDPANVALIAAAALPENIGNAGKRDPQVVESVTRALGLIGGEEARQWIEGEFRKDLAIIINSRAAASQGWSWLADSGDTEALWAFAGPERDRVAFLALSRMGAVGRIPGFARYLDDPSAKDRAVAGLALFPWAGEGKAGDHFAEVMRDLEREPDPWTRLAGEISLVGAGRKTREESLEVLRDVRGQWKGIWFKPETATLMCEALAKQFEPEAWAAYFTEREVKKEITTPEAFAGWLADAGLTLDAGISVWPGRIAAGRKLSPRAALARFDDTPVLSKGRVEIRRGEDALVEWESRLRAK